MPYENSNNINVSGMPFTPIIIIGLNDDGMPVKPCAII